MDENSLASELLKELKAQTRRWFIAFILMSIIEGATVAWFTLPTEETTTTEQVTIDGDEKGNAIYYDSNHIGGDLNNGENTSDTYNYDQNTENQPSPKPTEKRKKRVQ